MSKDNYEEYTSSEEENKRVCEMLKNIYKGKLVVAAIKVFTPKTQVTLNTPSTENGPFRTDSSASQAVSEVAKKTKARVQLDRGRKNRGKNKENPTRRGRPRNTPLHKVSVRELGLWDKTVEKFMQNGYDTAQSISSIDPILMIQMGLSPRERGMVKNLSFYQTN